MNSTQFAVIALAVVALGTIGIIAAGAPAAEAAQKIAPGQSDCNPGLLKNTPTCGPPGQNAFGNPGQCQLTAQENGATKETAHDECHEHVP